MPMSRLVALATLVLIAVLTQTTAVAQVPAHQPGTICATPRFWCWAPYPGPPGARCACPSPEGWIQGVLI
jgi:hypothetical protein